jgi:hypothetical protein
MSEEAKKFDDEGSYPHGDDSPAEEEIRGSNPDSGDPDESVPSRQELLESYMRARQLMAEKTQELETMRTRLDAMGEGARNPHQRSDDAALAREIQEAYKKDPVATTAMLIQQAQMDAMHSMEARVHQILDRQRNFGRLMNEFINDPLNSALKPYQQEFEFLILEKGLSPAEAANLIRRVQNGNERASQKRSAAAKAIRNRSAVETGSDPDKPADKEREFNRALKSSKTLDEMFSRLRKINV